MKKILLGSLLLGALFTACSDDEDYNAGIASPQASDATVTQKFGDGSVTEVGVINLAEVTTETVKVADITAPSHTSETAKLDSMTITFFTDDSEESFVESIQEDGLLSTATFTSIVESFFGKRPVERQMQAKLTAYLSDGTQAFLINSGVFNVKAIPAAPHISENYYVVGGTLDWAGSAASKEQKFSHSGADVYEDPVFTIVIDGNADGDTWFAIGDDAALDAIGNGDWSQLLGTKGESTDLSGSMDTRTNLGGDHSFCVSGGAKKIKITINMMDYSYNIEPVNIADTYYLIGGPGEWSAESARTMTFSRSAKDVFEDPYFTYVFAGTGSDMWFAFGDGDAIDGVESGDWSKLFGTTGASEDLSGSFDRRYNLDGDHSFHVDGSAKFYRFQVNMAEMTYTISELNFDPFVYFIGATDGWANAEQKLALTDDGGVYTGYLYMADPNGWGNEFKFQKTPGNWDTEINSGHMTGGITGDLADGGGNFKAAAGEGVYYVTLDLANGTLNGVKVNMMGIIGDFNGWGGDVEMTWNATDYCFEATNAGVNANGWKFRINSDWGINLGGNDSVEPSTNISDLVANGKNLGAVGSTIKLYPTRKTSDKIFCTVE